MQPAQSDQNADDAALLQRVRAGDASAFVALIERHQDRLRMAISYYCRNVEAVEECVQESFVQAYAGLTGDKAGAIADFYPWLRGIAFNHVRKEARRTASHRRNGPAYMRWLHLSRVEADPDLVQADERTHALSGCLQRLPDGPRQLLEAHYRDGRSLEELASELNASLGAMRVRMVRIRASLRACIERGQAPVKSP